MDLFFNPVYTDPYVKIMLLYNDQVHAKRKTKIKKQTLNPSFDETFVFELPPNHENLKKMKLDFVLKDYDRFGANDVIGKVAFGDEKWTEIIASPSCEIKKWHQLCGSL